MMTLLYRLGVAVALGFVLSLLAALNAQAADYRPDTILVKYKTQKQLRAQHKPTALENATLLEGDVEVERWQLTAEQDMRTTLDSLNAEADIDYAEPDYARPAAATPNDSDYSRQWDRSNLGTPVRGAAATPGADMNLPAAWDLNTGSREIIIAVLDDGVALNHPDLRANIWTNSGEIPNNGIDDDRNGYVDDVHGWDFADNDNNTDHESGDLGHGTRVAGVIGGVGNNATGIAGVNWKISIMPLRFDYFVSTQVKAMEYARLNGAHIINMSFGGADFSQTEFNAMQEALRAGILVVGAAGNHQQNNDRDPFYPASHDLLNIMSVAASDYNDQIVHWSQWGQTTVDIAAPGLSIYTTRAATGNTAAPTWSYHNGTSFSAPQIAGLAGLIKSYRRDADFMELRARIIGGAKTPAVMRGKVQAGGRPDALASMNLDPQPMVIIDSMSLSAGSNQRLDPGETATLTLMVENLWLDAEKMQLSLNSSHPQLQVNPIPVSLDNFRQGDARFVSFQLTLAESFTGYAKLPLELAMVTPGHPNQSRYLQLDAGIIDVDSRSSNTVQSDGQDDFHHYHLDLSGTSQNLNVLLTAPAGVDLLVRRNIVPGQKIILDRSQAESGTFVGVNENGQRRVSIGSPGNGTYHILVVRTDAGSANYQLEVNYQQVPANTLTTASAPSGGGGGGGGGAMGWILAALIGIWWLGLFISYRQQRKRTKA